METGGNAPHPQLNHNPCPWDHLPPSTFGFAGDGFPFHQNHNNRRHNFHHDAVGDNQFHQVKAPPDESFGGGGGYGQSKHHFIRKRKFDHNDGGNYAKLFVGAIPRTVTEEQIRRKFEEHGKVVEVVLITDKRTGQQQEYCFVKYALVEDADRAIAALHNQYALPGAMGPLRVKYADGERERLGLMRSDSAFSGPGMVHKVYVNGLNKEASKEEILEIFSSFGVVVDVYIMRDQTRQSRGCGFVGFSHRYMAVAAINGLDGTYVMRGCDRPLAVRFADPKKPKNGELRSSSTSADMRGSNWPNASHVDNSSAATQESTTNIQAGIFSPAGNQLQCPASCEMEQAPEQPLSPYRIPIKQLETLQVNSQSFRQMDSQLQILSHFNQTSTGNIEQCHDSQSPHRDFVESSAAVRCFDPGMCALSGRDFPEASLHCDWSEHICPDGYKYYYNCVTCESRNPFDLLLQRLLPVKKVVKSKQQKTRSNCVILRSASYQYHVLWNMGMSKCKRKHVL
uniref:RRM domain-containing protein n=1 Tax=Opuntia streptacantha TaxID=393608 RepID=A0A7C8Z5U5_OPUST